MKFQYILLDNVVLDVEVSIDDGAPYFTHLEPSYELVSVHHDGVEIDTYPVQINTAEFGDDPVYELLDDLIIEAARMVMCATTENDMENHYYQEAQE